MTRPCSEDELLQAVTEAMTYRRWRWTHIRRSDKAVSMGFMGLPDILAVRHGKVLAWELKSATGRPTTEQLAWLDAWREAGADARIVRPADLDECLEALR